MPWGNGSGGATTLSAEPNTRATITGTTGQTTSTIGSAILYDGDIVLIHQTRGSGAGQWEFNRVTSGTGSTSITWQTALQYTYVAGAQVVRVPLYLTATINSHSVTAWNGSTGGIEVVVAKESMTLSGTITGTSLGFIGPDSQVYNNVNNCGEGTAGASTTQSGSNGNGGGAGTDNVTNNPSGGAGGGNATAGNNGGDGDGGKTGGTGGLAVSSSDLVTLDMGGAGGAGGAINTGSWYVGGAGGNGGGIIILISKSITVSGAVANGGEAGGAGYHAPGDHYSGGGGGGGGGSVLMVCEIASLGTTLITADAGAGGSSGGLNSGGGGGDGAIAVHHSRTISGTTRPTFTNVTDTTLIETLGGSFIFNL
jgi:hypothetical protein